MNRNFALPVLGPFRFDQIVLYGIGFIFAKEVDLVRFVARRWPVPIYRLITTELIGPDLFLRFISGLASIICPSTARSLESPH
jgi:hypothetical protein